MTLDKNRSKVLIVRGKDPEKMVFKGLKQLGIKPTSKKVVIKPNLIIDKAPPVTTPVETVVALARYFKENFDSEIIVAEGSGWCETFEAFRKLGYINFAKKGLFKLIDLNVDDYILIKNNKALVLKEFKFPKTLRNSYLISAAVMKTHSITSVTLSLKNMLGATVTERKGIAKKSVFHEYGIHSSIVDVVSYLKPSLAVIDGRKACIGGELGGRAVNYDLMIFSRDLVAADAVASIILGYNPSSVTHLKLASQVKLGYADLDKIEVIELET
ncbi:hypothetical protein DRN86_00890 [Candidatus Geothermarchaeota archaeon]|nr:MAG: hypothetical protein DRN86_00890 [Candidatus Geothermarchaeota archaeon]